MMQTEPEKLVRKIELFIQKRLRGNTPFQNTSDLILYIYYKKSKQSQK